MEIVIIIGLLIAAGLTGLFLLGLAIEILHYIFSGGTTVVIREERKPARTWCDRDTYY